MASPAACRKWLFLSAIALGFGFAFTVRRLDELGRSRPDRAPSCTHGRAILPHPTAKANHTALWASTMLTNLVVALVVATLIWLIGVKAFLVVHLPIMLIAATAGVWLFYVQHQFEDAVWEREQDWRMHDAAQHGSSQYVPSRRRSALRRKRHRSQTARRSD
jgi:fatty acid desaturase